MAGVSRLIKAVLSLAFGDYVALVLRRRAFESILYALAVPVLANQTIHQFLQHKARICRQWHQYEFKMSDVAINGETAIRQKFAGKTRSG